MSPESEEVLCNGKNTMFNFLSTTVKIWIRKEVLGGAMFGYGVKHSWYFRKAPAVTELAKLMEELEVILKLIALYFPFLHLL